MKNTLINAGFIVKELTEGLLLIGLSTRKVYTHEVQAVFNFMLEDFQIWQSGNKVALLTGEN